MKKKCQHKILFVLLCSHYLDEKEIAHSHEKTVEESKIDQAQEVLKNNWVP